MDHSSTAPTGWLGLDSKLVKTLPYYVAFIALGLSSTSLGPTLNELAKNTTSTLSAISLLFLVRAFGYLIGSIVAGRLYDRQPGHPLLAGALALVIAMLVSVPLVSGLYTLAAIMFLLGAGEGLLDVGCNTLLVWIHTPNIGPHMNALHFFFGLGAVFSPLLVAQAMTAFDNISWVYWLIAIVMLPVLLWILALPSPSTPRHESTTVTGGFINYRLVGLLMFFFFLFVGVEVSYSGWIYNYALNMGLGTETSAAYLNSVFWIAFTVGRLIGIPISSWYRPRTILLVDLLGCILFVAIVLIWPQSATVLWVGIIGAGLAMASIFAVTLSWAERRLHITGFITSCFFIGTSLGAMTFPWLIGQLFEGSGPRVTMTTILLADLLALAVFLILMVYGGQPRVENKLVVLDEG